MKALFRMGILLLPMAASPSPAWAASDARPASDAAADPPPEELPMIALLPRLGALSYGRGAEQNVCAGACGGFAPVDASYAHRPALVFGADALFTPLAPLRFGPSVLYVLPTSVSLDGASDTFGIGSDLSLDVAVEVAPRVGPSVWLFARALGGSTILIPASDLRSRLNELRAVCPSGARGCDTLEGARLGWNAGLGIGALYAIGRALRLRADLLGQYYTVSLYEVEARLFLSPITVSERLSGARLFVMAGVEL